MTKDKKPADWKQVEKDYRAGIKSNRQIAEENGVTEGAIRKKAKQFEWKKDLTGAIKARALELVRTQEVRNEVRTEIAKEENEIVEENAQLQAAVIREHRTDIKKSRSMVQTLLNELEGSLVNAPEFHELAEILAKKRTDHIEDAYKQMREQNRLEELFTKFMQLPSQAGTLKQLTDSLKTLIALEREAFNLNAESDVKETLESFLSGL